MHSRATDRRSASKCQGKWPDQTLDLQLLAEPTSSKEAAATAAAATVLATVDERTATETKGALASYLAKIPDGAARLEGIRLGEAVAAKVLEARANDGADALDAYRPRTTPGV